MSDNRTLRLLVKGNSDIVDATMSRHDGGSKLDRGVREMVAATYPGVELVVRREPSSGFRDLRRELESGTSMLIEGSPDIVVLSLADEVASLGTRGATPEQAVEAVQEDLVAAVGSIKERVGAHILVANVSTVAPDDRPLNYHGLAEEPFSLRAHRLDLMLVGVSHDVGISIIDIDRILAELGTGGNVDGAGVYAEKACGTIAGEVVRVLDDYGFFDDRPLVAQVGAGNVGS